VQVAADLEPARLFDPAGLHWLEASRADQPLDFLVSTVVAGQIEQDRRLRRPVAGGHEKAGRQTSERHGQARPRGQPSGHDLARGLSCRQDPDNAAVRVEGDRVARNDHELAGERGGDLVDDALQHGKPQREDDGVGVLQHVAVAGSGDRSVTDLCRQRSGRLRVGAGESQGLAACGELAGDD
jgi:hypothetical protein